MASSSMCSRLSVLLLVLHQVSFSHEEVTTGNGIETGNVTTGPNAFYTSNTEITGTLSTNIGDHTSHHGIETSNVTTGPNAFYTSNTEITGTLSTNIGDHTSHHGAEPCVLDAQCPPFSSCSDQGDLQTCRCDLGLYFHHDLGCITARMFPARVSLSVLWNEEPRVVLQHGGEAEERLRHRDLVPHGVSVVFQNVLGHMNGYLSTSVSDLQVSEGHVTVVHSFSLLCPVTEENLTTELTLSTVFCMEGNPACIFPLTGDTYQSLSLCDFAMCDPSSSECESRAGLVNCVCRAGYYKHNPTDRTCRACGSGFRWTGNRCERCPLGFGGFNCEETLLLAVIVESCVGFLLLAAFITLLVYYFRRKEKPQHPSFMDSIVLGVPPDHQGLRLPRAQFSWRREWEWANEAGKTPVRTTQDQASENAEFQMKTFGDFPRSSATIPSRGSHNLAFISDN